MNGVGGSITPATSGRVLILMSGAANNDTANDGCAWKIYVGTAKAPANGDQATGESISANLGTMTSPSPVLNLPFTAIGYAPALTVGTPYWIDLGFSTLVTGGKCTLIHVAWVAIEERRLRPSYPRSSRPKDHVFKPNDAMKVELRRSWQLSRRIASGFRMHGVRPSSSS
jgi:hypothetical protein